MSCKIFFPSSVFFKIASEFFCQIIQNYGHFLKWSLQRTARIKLVMREDNTRANCRNEQVGKLKHIFPLWWGTCMLGIILQRILFDLWRCIPLSTTPEFHLFYCTSVNTLNSRQGGRGRGVALDTLYSNFSHTFLALFLHHSSYLERLVGGVSFYVSYFLFTTEVRSALA